MKELRVGAVAMTSSSDSKRNVETAEFFIRDLAQNHSCDWVVLPEMFPYIGEPGTYAAFAETESHALLERLAKFARSQKIVLFAGSIPEKATAISDGDQKVFNTSYVFSREGDLLAKYRKIHLFNLRSPDGKKLFCEEDSFLPGSSIETTTIDGFRVGLSICYDLRFPELYRFGAKVEQPIDIWMVPSAFTYQTGKDHWEVLIRARAIENQCYVVACNQTGFHSSEKRSYGHSMIVDPWGEKLCDAGESEGVVHALVFQSRLTEVRQRLPALNDRKI